MNLSSPSAGNAGLLLALLPGIVLSGSAQSIPGLPEPGLVLYGAVTNANGAMPLWQGNVHWDVTGGGSTARVDSMIVNVNGDYFYLARIPFETRSVPGVTLTASPNTLPLTDPSTMFTRSATVYGTNAVLLPPATGSFFFGPGDRGRMDRVNLQVSFTFDPALDSDGDGAPDWAEAIAGTNPNDSNSVLKASSDIQPAAGGGIVVKWASVAGKTYSVHRATDVGRSFAVLTNGIPATPPQNQFTDANANANASAGVARTYFYRIQVNP